MYYEIDTTFFDRDYLADDCGDRYEADFKLIYYDDDADDERIEYRTFETPNYLYSDDERELRKAVLDDVHDQVMKTGADDFEMLDIRAI